MLKQIHGTSTGVRPGLPTCRVLSARVGWLVVSRNVKRGRGLLALVQKAEAAENIQ